jgi:tRNA (adenine37-N6)-methyltransferase
MNVLLNSIGMVKSLRSQKNDDFWGDEISCIHLNDDFSSESLVGLNEFSHVEILFLFHEVDESKIFHGSRHPRNNTNWPSVGIFAQRGKNRPNRIGSTICQIHKIEETKIYLKELDAIDGTPILDIKPIMIEFLPRQEIKQPKWSHEIMKDYWNIKK